MPILHWLTRNHDVQATRNVPYRLLEPVERLSYGDQNSGNLLIQGDNLEALKALLPFFAGQVQCIYIDPPYNTKSAFETYDDNLEHSTWLATMWPRLESLRDLLAPEGSIWVSIDDNEAHYLKVIMDEVFGRKNFIAANVWQKRYSRENREAIGDVHEYIIVYAKDPAAFKAQRNRVPLNEEQAKIYKNPNKDPKGRWRAIPMTAQGYRANQMYPITAPGGAVHYPPEGRCWSTVESEYKKLLAKGRIYFGRDNNSQPNIIRYLSEVEGLTPWTWWPSDEVGHTDEAKKEIHALFGKKDAFETPKPERLIERILHIATNPGDLVLDSFLGSGTTSAVAHKMNRRYIGIEMGEHAEKLCRPRLSRVIDGEQGGISATQDWHGGGGFRFCRLGKKAFDEQGRICLDIRFPVLAAHVWFSETHTPWLRSQKAPVLGVHDGKAYALLYNGVLGDKRPGGGNVLTSQTLAIIRAGITKFRKDFSGPLIIYGESSRIGDARLKRERVTFKQTPYDVKAR